MMGKDGTENNVQLGTELCPHADSGSPKVKKYSFFFFFSPRISYDFTWFG